MQPSFSKICIQFTIQGKGFVKAEVFRHLSPKTLNEVLRKIPFQGRITKFEDSFVYFNSGVIVGVEKSRSEFSKGDIAFLAANSSVCFFLKDCNIGRPMNLLGRVVEGFEFIEKASNGDVVTIERC